MAQYCHQFAEGGSCTFGSRCKFPHTVRSAAKKNICHQFAESGTCTYGSKCKYLHTNQRTGKTRSQKPNGKKKKRKAQRQLDHLDTFFAQYPDFDYQQDEPSTQEFYRLCDFNDWDKDDEERQDAREEFKTALVHQFNDLYGMDESDLESWKKLCLVLDVDPIPENLKECRDAVRSVHVNLVDLVDSQRTEDPVTVFDSLAELQEYTITNGMFFPKESAYAGGVLKYLLREITGSYGGRKPRPRRR